MLLLPASQPHLSFPPPAQRERQSLAGTAGCLGNTLCHHSGLEQELAYPCQSAGRIWAMPCVNRLSDFHSDSSGIGPTPPLSGKATPASLFLKAPRALLSSPISCLNYALFCAVVVFFLPCLLLPFLPHLLLLIPHPLPSHCLSLTLLFCEKMRTKILKFEVCCVLGSPPPPPPPPPTAQLSFALPSSLHLKGNTVFSMHKRLGAVNRMNPPGPMENIHSAAATVSLKGERGGGRGGWMGE